nr:MAG TPA: hypothetical protein [Caudoviricetes sp.]
MASRGNCGICKTAPPRHHSAENRHPVTYYWCNGIYLE